MPIPRHSLALTLALFAVAAFPLPAQSEPQADGAALDWEENVKRYLERLGKQKAEQSARGSTRVSAGSSKFALRPGDAGLVRTCAIPLRIAEPDERGAIRRVEPRTIPRIAAAAPPAPLCEDWN